MREIQKRVNTFKANPKNGAIVEQSVTLFHYDDPIDFLGRGLESDAVVRVWVSGHPYAYKQMENDTAIEHAFTIWQKLKLAGVSTPITYRMIEEKDRLTGLLMTDLTRDWQQLLISTNQTKLANLNQIKAVNPDLIKQFQSYDLQDPINQANFNQQVQTIAEQTANAGLFFNRRDITSATFDHTGNLRLILSDLGSIVSGVVRDQSLIQNHNRIALARFMDHLIDAQSFALMV